MKFIKELKWSCLNPYGQEIVTQPENSSLGYLYIFILYLQYQVFVQLESDLLKPSQPPLSSSLEAELVALSYSL